MQWVGKVNYTSLASLFFSATRNPDWLEDFWRFTF